MPECPVNITDFLKWKDSIGHEIRECSKGCRKRYCIPDYSQSDCRDCCEEEKRSMETERKKWMLIAIQELGVHETPGPAATARITEYDKHTSLMASSDEIPWCSAFMNYCLDTAGHPGTHSAAARSWLNWGVPMDKPVEGCIVILDRHDSRNPNAAHVTLFYKDNGDGTFEGLGGNQHDSVQISTFLKSKVLGYRWPKESETV